MQVLYAFTRKLFAHTIYLVSLLRNLVKYLEYIWALAQRRIWVAYTYVVSSTMHTFCIVPEWRSGYWLPCGSMILFTNTGKTFFRETISSNVRKEKPPILLLLGENTYWKTVSPWYPSASISWTVSAFDDFKHRWFLQYVNE